VDEADGDVEDDIAGPDAGTEVTSTPPRIATGWFRRASTWFEISQIMSSAPTVSTRCRREWEANMSSADDGRT
jgi:hypothetical protein